MDNLEVKIRKYEEKDKKSVRELCCDTGFWGNPIDQVFVDREIFADFFIRPYLEQEPEHTLVAEHDNQVIGYLTGYLGSNFELKSLPILLKVITKGLYRLVTGKYSHHKRTREFIKWALTKGLFQVPKHPKNTAHLHMNVKEDYRNRGVGSKLLKEYENMLIQNGINHYYGMVLSSNTKRTVELFKRLGFKFYSKIRTTAFKQEIKEPLYSLCIHKRLK